MKGKKKQKGARLGQHFLTGQWAAKKLVNSARIGSHDTVLEIGPGTGALTKELLATGARVIAIEKDEALVVRLKETFRAELTDEHLTLIEGDVRDLDLKKTKMGPYILAANIPYYITGEIIRQFLTSDTQPTTMALLVQKEVAQRIIGSKSARGGSALGRKESILSISVKAYGDPEIAAVVSRGNFAPPPSVDSAILAIRNISRKFFEGIDEEFFFNVVRTGFSSKRKFLAGNLGKKFGRERAEGSLAAANLAEKARAEDVALSQWKEIAKKLLPGHE